MEEWKAGKPQHRKVRAVGLGEFMSDLLGDCSVTLAEFDDHVEVFGRTGPTLVFFATGGGLFMMIRGKCQVAWPWESSIIAACVPAVVAALTMVE